MGRFDTMLKKFLATLPTDPVEKLSESGERVAENTSRVTFRPPKAKIHPRVSIGPGLRGLLGAQMHTKESEEMIVRYLKKHAPPHTEIRQWRS